MNKFVPFVLIVFSFIKADAQNASALRVGDSLFALGEYSQAILQYEKAENADSKIAQAYQAIGNTTKALYFYEKAVEKAPEPLSQYRYGKLLLQAGHLQKSDSFFSLLHHLNPNNPEFAYQLGLAKEQQNDSTALAQFYLAYALDKNHQNALYKLAKFSAEKRDFEKVKKYIEEGLAADTNSTRFLQLKAVVAYVQKDYQTAATAYEQLIELNQSNVPLHENLAKSYNQTYRHQKAIDQYAILIQQYDDKNPSWHFDIAKNFEALHYLDKAQHHFEIAILLQDIPLDDLYIALASVFKKQKNYKRQFEILQKAVIENPENESTCYLLATAADNYFQDKSSIINYYKKCLDSFKEGGRYSKLAKQRIEDLKSDIHFNEN